MVAVMVASRASVFFVLCCSLNLLLLVKGLYVLQLEILGYDNPTQQRISCNRFVCFGVCCDDGSGPCTNGDRRCDTFFTYCLRPLNATGSGCGSPSSGHEIQSDVNVNDAAVDFSQSTVLGLSNPINFSGLTNDWNGVQIYIEVRDRDSGSSQPIGTFILFATTEILPLNQPSGNVMFVRSLVTINVNVTVLCARNFQGSDCTQCIPGFTGPMCDEIDDCVGETCSGNRQCIDGLNTFTCECNPGFTGPECMENINECIGVNCSGNGQCVDEIGSYRCNCSAGYTGNGCEINIDDCSPDPCGANGQCIDGVESFTCNCDTGYTGALCDSDIDECLSNPCGVNGQCENQEGSFNCSCNPGFTGDLCQINIDDCVGVNCSGNGVCLDSLNSFVCQCSPGFSGTLCFEAVVELRGSKLSIPIVGGVIGGVLIIVIALVLIIIIVAKYKIKSRSQFKPDALDKDIEMKENEIYGVSMAALQAKRQQPLMPDVDDALMSRNVCYATTQHMEIVDNECYGHSVQHMEIVDNECYGCVPEN